MLSSGARGARGFMSVRTRPGDSKVAITSGGSTAKMRHAELSAAFDER